MSGEPDLDHFRTLLLKLEQTLRSLEKTGDEAAKTVELDQARVGRLSRIDAMQAQAMSQASNQRRAATLVAIKAALARLDLGTYGECARCGELIDPRRLEFDPTLSFCIQCAE